MVWLFFLENVRCHFTRIKIEVKCLVIWPLRERKKDIGNRFYIKRQEFYILWTSSVYLLNKSEQQFSISNYSIWKTTQKYDIPRLDGKLTGRTDEFIHFPLLGINMENYQAHQNAFYSKHVMTLRFCISWQQFEST